MDQTPSAADPRSPSRLVLRRLPEVLSAIAVVGIGWYLWPEPSPAPALRCDAAEPPKDCFVRVPGARILLGAQATDPEAPGYDAAAQPSEGPPTSAAVHPFWIQRTETMVASWRACVRAGRCDPADVGEGSTAYPVTERDDPRLDAFPLNRVTWKGAADVCAFLGGRLPTEAEWEVAARGPGGRRWPWGPIPRCAYPNSDQGFPRFEEVAEDAACVQASVFPADSIPEPTPEGVLGLGGNLWEWTLDRWRPTLDAPAVAGDDAPRAQRGGSFLSESPRDLRATVRGGVAPGQQLDDVGLRCVVGRRP